MLMNHTTSGVSRLTDHIQRYVMARLLFLAKLFLATTVAGLVFTAGLAQAGLVNEWRGDDYSGGNWVDHIGSVAATNSGTPLAVPAVFNAHTGVSVNGGFFAIPAGTAPAGSSNFTVVVVVKPDAPGPSYTGYWDATPLIGFDIGGAGQTDWGISWSGTRFVDGVGVQNVSGSAADVTAATADLAIGAVHALALQVSADLGTVMTFADGVLVQSNKVISVNPRSSANIAYVGGGVFRGTFVGQYAAIQVYNDATVDCVALTQNLLTTYATPAAILLPYAAGAVPGQNAAVMMVIPASSSASGPFTVTLASDNPAVVANTTVTFPKGTISQTVNLPVLSVGVARVTATGTGVASAVVRVAGLDESGLVNRWVADTYNSGDPVWTDTKGGVGASATGSPLAIAAAFGTAHKGVTRNGGGFTIPLGTAPGGLSDFTVAVVIKPTALGNTGGNNYYNGKYIVGYDIGGAGQADWGLAWGGTSPALGQRILAGIGRSGGDSGLNSGPSPLALNQTHAAVMQVNSGGKIQTLWVDGAMKQYNANITMIAMDTRDIPLLTDYDGLCAEVRIYTNSTVDGAGLSGMLQSIYAGVPPITLAAATSPFVAPGGMVNLTVGVPASATLSSPVAVTVTSDNPAVAYSTNLTLATGKTSTNFALPILSVGAANLVATGPALSDSAPVAIGGLSPRVLVEAFRASSAASFNSGTPPNDGDAISLWAGDTNSAALASAGTVFPYFKANATLAGTPSVIFSNNSILTLEGDPSVNPVSGRTNFSVAIVYKGAGTGAGGSPWYQQSGIVNAESGGVVDDWGCTLDSLGQFNAGLGNPDVTMPQPGYNTSDSLFHAAVAAFDVLNGQMRVTVDDKPTTVSTTAISIAPRGNYPTRFGDNNFNGEIAEVRFYDGALTIAEATNLINGFQTTYKLMWPDQSLCSITAAVSGGMAGDDIPVAVSIPPGFNAVSAVSVKVVNGNPNAVALPGGTPITLTFAAGATNVQTLTAHLAAPGSSTLTASASGLLNGTLALAVLGPATLVEAFRAHSLTNQFPGIADGGPVSSWAGDIHPSTMMQQNSVALPTFVAHATPSGLPSVAFDAANSTAFIINGTDTPVGGLNNFSFAVVFKEAAAGSGDGQWYNMPAIIDAEEPGAQNDWGIAFDANGQLNFGVGNSDYTLLDPHNLVSSTAYHVAILTSYPLKNQMTITVDGYPTTTTPPGATIGAAPRNMANVYIGRSFSSKYFTGELVEWDVYNGVLTASEIAALNSSLRVKYGILVPTDLVLGLTRVSANSIKLSWPSIATASGYMLESSPSVNSGWGPSGLTVTTEGNSSVATDTIGGAAKFYRLHRP